MQQLTINKNEKPVNYPVKWDYSVIRFFCNRRGITKISDYTTRIGSISFDENLTIENVDDLAYLVLSLVDRGCELTGAVNDLTISDTFAWVYGNADNIKILMDLISGAIREVKPEKKTAKTKAH